jgi:hypothetical protein
MFPPRKKEGTLMLEPTITQNSALYFAQHNVAFESAKQYRGLKAKISSLFNRRRRSVSEPVQVLRFHLGPR